MICRYCGNDSGEVAGKAFKCGKCGQYTEVPAGDAPAAPAKKSGDVGEASAIMIIGAVLGGLLLCAFLIKYVF